MDTSNEKKMQRSKDKCEKSFNMDYKKVNFLFFFYDNEENVEEIVIEKSYCDIENSILFRKTTDEELKMPFTITAGGHYCVGDKHYTIREKLNNYQLIFTVSGNAIIEYNNVRYNCVPNSLLLLDCNLPHRYIVPSGQIWDYKHIHFLSSSNTDIIVKKAQGFDMANEIEMNKFFDMIFYEIQNYKEYSPYILANYISNILTEKIILSSKSKMNHPHLESIEKAARYMREHYSEHINVGEISKNEFISVYHFTRLFKEYFGTTPYDYLINYRINQAKILLLQGKSITEISEKCGFGNANNFSRIFKKYNKISPGQYKKQH